ncbi:hypothetical protein FOB64_000870 [Candida albicans]|uniref:Uncharacterized protein n=1 Tax=Candida albicans TaxID=5476 RepID=A0A8H6C5B8_CANAX|nr:hypothetical protein FOB64_000870 [Candida albicans]KGR07636.1 hypothetical protein MG9_05463 [Candida albicans P37037]KGT64672.1 hypothetical protein MEK_05454 [Candida albicans 12C]KHC71072.1 hypothetical protein W5Q_05554 [Candida albicans SC5314]KHC79683.1 hypothetical protein I503_05518 [Candida albicans SC5314]
MLLLAKILQLHTNLTLSISSLGNMSSKKPQEKTNTSTDPNSAIENYHHDKEVMAMHRIEKRFNTLEMESAIQQQQINHMLEKIITYNIILKHIMQLLQEEYKVQEITKLEQSIKELKI